MPVVPCQSGTGDSGESGSNACSQNMSMTLMAICGGSTNDALSSDGKGRSAQITNDDCDRVSDYQTLIIRLGMINFFEGEARGAVERFSMAHPQ
jgi:hypothetical protein